MYKKWIFVTLITLAAMFFATANVLASPVTSADFKRTPFHFVGPQATPRATWAGPGNNGNGQGNDPDRGNAPGTGNGGWPWNFGKGNGNAPGNGNGNDPGKGNGPGNGTWPWNFGKGNGNGQDKGNDHGKGNPPTKRDNYQGVIAAINAPILTLTLNGGASQDFTVDANTQIRIPTLHGQASLGDLKVGERVTVRASVQQDKSLLAGIILVIPGKPEIVHRVGVVTDYQPGASIAIQDKDGSSFTFLITPGTKILPSEFASLLAVGIHVTIIAPRDVTQGPLTAQAIVVHPPELLGTPTATPTATYTATDTATLTDTPVPTDTPMDTPTDTATP